MKRMLEEADKHKKKKLTTDLIHKIYYAPTNDAAEKCIALIPQEKGKQLVRILGGIFFFYGFSMYIHLANIMRGLLVRKAC